MGLIVMRHVNSDTLEDLINESELMLEPLDLGVSILNSQDKFGLGQDFDKRAKAIKQEIGSHKIKLIYHSGIPRAEITARALGIKLGYEGKYVKDGELYERFSDSILKHITEKSDCIVVAHKPAMLKFGQLSQGSDYAQAYRITKGEWGGFSAKYIDPNQLG